MFRTTDIILIAAMISAAAFTYKTKHEAENQLAEIRRLEDQIQFEKDSYDVLKADWSLLTQPKRLQRLATTFRDELQLYPVQSYQFATIEEIPMRPLTIDGLIAGIAPIDAAPTGSIEE